MKKHTATDHARRNFLRLGVAGAAGLALGPLFGGPKGSEIKVQAAPITGMKRLIVYMMRGGNDGLNTLVPINLNSYYDRRTGLAIAASTALDLNSGPAATQDYMLHPSLANVATAYRDGDVAFIQGAGYPNENLSHFTSEDIWGYGVRGNFSTLGIPISGWIARYADLYTTTGTGVVSIGQGRPKELVGANTAQPLILQDLEGFELNPDWAHQNNQPLREEIVQSLVAGRAWDGARADAAAATEQGYALSAQVQAAVDNFTSTETYGGGRQAKHVKGIAQLIQAGFDTQIFFTGQGGFDTHSTQSDGHSDLLTTFDGGLGSLIADLKTMSLWDDTVILVFSEFGRRNYVNGSGGTDHGHGNTMMVMGGGVTGGLYGPEPTNTDLDAEFLDYGVDFRTVYKQVIQNHLGRDPSAIFPEMQDIDVSPGAFI